MSYLPSAALIRQRVATAVGAALPDVRESVFHPKLIGYDGGGNIGTFYSVEVPTSEFTDPRSRIVTRTAANQSSRVTTAVVIRYLHRLKADTAKASYDEAIGVEYSILSAFSEIVYTKTNSLQPRTIEREVVADGSWLLITVQASITHDLGGDS